MNTDSSTTPGRIAPSVRSWVEVPANSDFPIQNLPFGVFRYGDRGPRLATALGDYIVDLAAVAEHGFFDDLLVPREVFSQPYLNDFIALGRPTTRAVRQRLCDILDDDLDTWDAHELADFLLLPLHEVEMLMPLNVGDYTDFYSSREHATNVGSLFRDPDKALLPNWLHLPVGYHGRASSIVVSGTPIRRPHGQILSDESQAPIFSASRRLDFELEMAFVVGTNTDLGERVPVQRAEDYIFGVVLFNDWSARDIQKWEYQPLGPFLGKSFASTISPWVVTLDALEPFRTTGPEQEPAPLPYLRHQQPATFDIQLEVQLGAATHLPVSISRSNFRYLYWSMAQQLAHHTVNGCNIRIGDLMASGTISGPTPDSYGSLLELSQGGKHPISLPNDGERRFLEDGDTVILRAYCQNEHLRLGFGEAKGVVMPAVE